MPEGVGQCLSGNGVRLVLYCRPEHLRRSNDGEREAGSVILRGLLSTLGQAINELAFIRRAAAEIANAVPRFPQDLIGALEDVVYRCSARIMIGYALGNTLHAECDALEALQERVVQLPCDALPLFHLGQ